MLTAVSEVDNAASAALGEARCNNRRQPLPPHSSSFGPRLAEADQLDVKDEGRVGRDHRRIACVASGRRRQHRPGASAETRQPARTAGAVAVVGGARQLGTLRAAAWARSDTARTRLHCAACAPNNQQPPRATPVRCSSARRPRPSPGSQAARGAPRGQNSATRLQQPPRTGCRGARLDDLAHAQAELEVVAAVELGAVGQRACGRASAARDAAQGVPRNAPE